MHFRHIIEVPPTWGYWAPPSVSAERLRVTSHLDTVEPEGIVVDLGSGPASALSAYIHTVRPDIQVIPVDPGYSLPGIEPDLGRARADILEFFEAPERTMLESSDLWHTGAIAAYSEELPLGDQTADLVISHAAVPNYCYDTQAAAKEVARVLKIGSLGLFGPMYDYEMLEWAESLNIAKKDFDLDVQERVGTLTVNDNTAKVHYSSVKRVG